MFQLGPITVRHSTPAYGSQMNGEDGSHLLRQRRCFICTEFKADLAAASLAAHMEIQHGQLVHAVATTAPALIPTLLVE